MCRFGGVLHDWPESYFKAQQSKGGGLAGVFKQAMDLQQAGKISRSRSILSRMFPNSPLARLKSLTVCHATGLTAHFTEYIYNCVWSHFVIQLVTPIRHASGLHVRLNRYVMRKQPNRVKHDVLLG